MTATRGKILPWSARTRRRHVAAGRVLRTVCPVLPAAEPPNRPIFVIGAPRSGTTLLFQTLDQSRELASLGVESHLLWDMYHPEVDPAAGHAVGASAARPHERRTLDWVIARIAKGRRYLDKYPRLCLRIEYLRALYPDAVFVYLRRDGRAVVSSLITAWRTPGRFGLGTQLPGGISIDGYDGDTWKFLVPPGWAAYARGRRLAEVCAFQWSASNAAVLESRERLGDAGWIDVRYEELVAEPVPTIARIAAELGIPDHKVVAHAAKLGDHVTRTAVERPRADKWRTENGAEVASVADAIAPMMARLGYPSA